MRTPRPSTVLVVDDEPDMAEMIRFCLTQRGHKVAIADGGARAIEMSRPTPFQLAICDFTMPGLDGVETARALKAMWPAMPIIIVSGYATERALSAMRGGVMDGWLNKPFTVEELEEAMDRVLRSGRRTASPAAAR